MNNKFIWSDRHGFYIIPIKFCFRLNDWKELGISFDTTNRIFFHFWFGGITIEHKEIRNFLKKYLNDKFYYSPFHKI